MRLANNIKYLFYTKYIHNFFTKNHFCSDQMEEKTSSVRRDRLLEMQARAQKYWAENKINEATVVTNQKKFMLTFPYPSPNGRLHMGHAFSFTKADFTARFKRLCGYNVLFAQGFHCNFILFNTTRYRYAHSSRE